MISLFLLVAGFVGLAIPEHFRGQDTIAVGVLILGAVLVAFQMFAVVQALSTVRQVRKQFSDHDRLRRATRDRRGF